MLSTGGQVVLNRTAVVYFSDVNLSYGMSGTDVKVKNLDALANQILHVLSTPIGSREFEPTFGSQLPYLLWEPLDETTAWLMRTAAYDALSIWLSSRIELQLGATSFTPMEDEYAYIGNISYRVLTNNINAKLTVKLPANK